MSKVATVKETVKETLVGSKEPEQLSAQTKARFNRHASKDAETGELYLGPDQFIDAVAPPQEDYVSPSQRPDRRARMAQTANGRMRRSTKSSASSTRSCSTSPTAPTRAG